MLFGGASVAQADTVQRGNESNSTLPASEPAPDPKSVSGSENPVHEDADTTPVVSNVKEAETSTNTPVVNSVETTSGASENAVKPESEPKDDGKS